MAVSMIVALISTRIILKALGAEDFGIFNVVGGSIALLGFFNSTLQNATQRFMSWTIGSGDMGSQRRVFNVTLIIQFIIGIITAVTLLIVKPWLFDKVMVIPEDRLFSAEIIYYCLLISSFLTIINVPYESIINAHENMGYYTIIGFIESLLKLLIAYWCYYAPTDRLILYGICMASTPMITLTIMKVYCHKKYKECLISPIKYFDKNILKNISSFSGWNFLTAITHIASLQGMGLVLNHFYGAILNAAQGIAGQINGVFSLFSSNMLRAVNPVITKKASKGETESVNTYSLTSCKYASYLFIAFGIPVTLNINYILYLWLGEVPEFSALFCIMQFITLFIPQTISAIATAIYASGKIKYYAIFKGLCNLFPLGAIYLAFYLGGGPIWLYIPVIVFLCVGGNIVVLYYGRKECHLSIRIYFVKVILPLSGSIIIMVLLGLSVHFVTMHEFIRLVTSSILSIIGLIISGLWFGISKKEKIIFIDMIKKISKK